MALNRRTTYPLRTESSADYPGGKAKNRSSDSADDGYPFDADILNEKFGFYDKLILEAGIARSGVPDTVNESDHYNAMIKLMGTPNTKWDNRTAYKNPALVFGSDDRLYRSNRDSVGKDPTSSKLDWSVIDQTSGGFEPIFHSASSKWEAGLQYNHPSLVFGSDDKLYISKAPSSWQDPTTSKTHWMLFSRFLDAYSHLFNASQNYIHPTMVLSLDGNLYISKRNSVGKEPASSPDDWRRIGSYENVPQYVAGKQYPVGSLVIDFEKNIFYKNNANADGWISLQNLVSTSLIPLWEYARHYDTGDLVFNQQAELYVCDQQQNRSTVNPSEQVVGWSKLAFATSPAEECMLFSVAAGAMSAPFNAWPQAPNGVGYAWQYFKIGRAILNTIPGASSYRGGSDIYLPAGLYQISGHAQRFSALNEAAPISGAALMVSIGLANPAPLIKGPSSHLPQNDLQDGGMPDVSLYLNGVIATTDVRTLIQVGLMYTSFDRPLNDTGTLKYNTEGFGTDNRPIDMLQLLLVKLG